MSAARIFVLLFVLFAVGCGDEPPPAESVTETTATATAEDEAAEPELSLPEDGDAFSLIANSTEFAEFQAARARLTLPTKLSYATSTTERSAAMTLADAGWLTIEADGRVVLTRGQYDYRFSTSGDEIAIGPIARKHMKSVQAVYEGREGQGRVDFTWEWMTDDIGELYPRSYRGDQHAIATLEIDGSEWRVLRIDHRTRPND